MRPIKFRGRRTDGKWVFGDLSHTYRITVTADIPCIRIAGYDVNEDTIGQFTGLSDKNGKEIYEGDILVWGENGCKSCPLVVMFKHGAFGYKYIGDWFHSFAGNTNFTFNPLNTDVRFEIIGNIHDNPELMKGGSNGNS